jgi:protein-S-isoprenylcysteine O-methyltransferase Ste14
MKATDFEFRHQTLFHLLVVAVSLLTYSIDRDDIVWALVHGQSHPQLLERLLFALATVLIGAGAALRTSSRAYPESAPPMLGSPVRRDGPYRYLRYPQHFGNLLFAVGLGFLAPVWGFVLLVAGEAILVFRLIQREKEPRTPASVSTPRAELPPPFPPRLPFGSPIWREAFRRESAKWGLFLTMIVFTLLLRDRVAEILAAASFLIWIVLNCGSFQAQTPR